MNLDVKFSETNQHVDVQFDGYQTASSGGYDEGYADGYTKGHTEGVKQGYADGQEVGYANGYEDGNTEGYAKGHDNGMKEGYSVGYEAGLMGSQEDAIIDGTLTGEYVNDRVTAIRQYAIYQQYSLERVKMNGITSVPVYSFGHCRSLKYAEFASATYIGAAAFLMCYQLTALVLRSASVVSLANTNAFGSCYHLLGEKSSAYNPNGDKDGYIYVPDNLVEQYKTAANWSTYASQIKPISELEE